MFISLKRYVLFLGMVIPRQAERTRNRTANSEALDVSPKLVNWMVYGIGITMV